MLDEEGYKWLTAERLHNLIGTLPRDSRVMTNVVGNLLVLTADGKSSLAYVDFVGRGEVEWMQADRP